MVHSLRSFEETVIQISYRLQRGNRLSVETPNPYCIAHVQQFVSVISVDLFDYLLVPVRLQRRFLHLARYLFLQGLLDWKQTATAQSYSTAILFSRCAHSQSAQLLIELEVDIGELLRLAVSCLAFVERQVFHFFAKEPSLE